MAFDPFELVASQDGAFDPQNVKNTWEETADESNRSSKKKKKKKSASLPKDSSSSKKKSKKSKAKKDKKAKKSKNDSNNSLLAGDTDPMVYSDWGSDLKAPPPTINETGILDRQEPLKDDTTYNGPQRQTLHGRARSFESSDTSLDPHSVFGHIDDDKFSRIPAASPLFSSSLSPGTAPTSEMTSTSSSDDPLKALNPTFAEIEDMNEIVPVQQARLDKIPSMTPSVKISRDLLANYLIAKGEDPQQAAEISEDFVAKEAIRQSEKAPADRKAKQGGKMSELSASLASNPTSNQQHTSIPGYERAEQPGAMPMDSRAFGAPRRRQDRPTSAPPAAMTYDVEAMLVKEEGGELPVVYAESTPLSFKHMWREKYVRRGFFATVVIIGIVVGVVCSVAFRNAGGTGETTSSPSWAPSSAPTVILDEYLESAYSVSRREDVDADGSAQRRAVSWLSTFDQAAPVGDDWIQRYALTTVAYSLGYTEWLDMEEWLNPMLHECDWAEGIECEADLSGRRTVTKVDITRNGLQGVLPPEIGLISDLEWLKLPKNPLLVGTLPDTIGDLSRLSVVDVASNGIGGPIPSTIGQATDLIQLNLEGNRFSSSLPSELYKLTFLRELILADNLFTGTINTDINDCRSLVTFDLKKNSFSGTWPLDIDELPSLDTVSLDFNRLTGTLPNVTDSLVKKLHFSASHNQFEGPITIDPSALVVANVSLLRLQHVDISHNRLTGTLSRVLGFLPTLEHMDFSGNSFSGYLSGHDWQNIEFLAAADNLFTGTIPMGWPAETLRHLDLSGNAFDSGGVPEELCDFVNLEFLLLSNNNLGSSMPSCLGNLKKLRSLEMDNSVLVGTIPRSLGVLSSLEILNLQQNQLTGPIPASLMELTTLKHLRLNLNELTGFIPYGLSGLSDLRNLDLSFNRLIGDLPDLANLTKLTNLSLMGTEVYGSISGLCNGQLGFNLSVAAIGCKITCDCCFDADLCTGT